MENEPVYTDEEWGLLVGLPLSVVVAASAAESDGARTTHAENSAGMEVISDGRVSASPLVVMVATELLTRTGDPEAGEEPPVITLRDPETAIADVIERARQAHDLLLAKAAVEEAEAYRHWLVSIADVVVTAAKSGSVLGLGGERVTEAERGFRDELAAVLSV